MTSPMGRVRRPSRSKAENYKFVNPYPEMSEPEARVFIFLTQLGVPFSWRWFDGDAQAPQFATIVKPFGVPEFTLTEYRIAIIVQGAYWGGMPGVLDLAAAMKTWLEADGWKVGILYEGDIINDVQKALFKEFPGVSFGSIPGGPKNMPTAYDKKFNLRRRLFAATQGFNRRILLKPLDNLNTYTGKRKITKGDKRQPIRIIEAKPPVDSSIMGIVSGRYRGVAPAAKKKVTRTPNRKFALPVWQKWTGK